MPSTIIDSLVVELGLDPSKFSSGQQAALQVLRHLQETSEKGAREVESQTRKSTSLLAAFRREALSTAGVFFGGMGVKEFIGYITTLDASTGRFAKTLDMNVREVGAWQSAVKQVGGTTESANAALQGLSTELARFSISGNSGVLGVLSQFNIRLFDRNEKLKTSGQIMLELSDRIKDHEPRKAAAMLGMLGIDQNMINLLLLGRTEVEKYLDAGRKAGTTTETSSKAAQEFQTQLSLLKDSASNAGRSLMEWIYTPLTLITKVLKNLIQLNPEAAGVLMTLGGIAGLAALGRGARNLLGRVVPAAAPAAGAAAATVGAAAAKRGLLGRAGAALTNPYTAGALAAYEVLKPTGVNEDEADRPWWKPLDGPKPDAPAGGGLPTVAEMEAYIRAAAVRRGIDPDVAVAVARSEGLHHYTPDNPTAQSVSKTKGGQREPSFGPFQLYYGGGLGNAFTAQTGQHAADPSTWRQQVDFSLDEARKGGWGPWHGWKGMPYAGIRPGGAPGAGALAAAQSQAGSTTTVTTSIGQINVNAPQARDADGVAREIAPALDRQIKAGSANQGGF